ncbi:Nif3-like dinuclear metal center hexameric protein [Aequorivita lipolytica]|uniref:GTP cyclohydrolase 1 type 2 homolog n=1 Tax=Aequorivita lipolytica TaxID=153267 RepID=A0A5C6YP71_9FLAO|nr:Nif3-like dinuclear metal center hexameric protein [Aequorivita lipolytica]TXD68643.1 Nif3-like dinuclear metal center hexameric protein [Aequorivita lipolytica]SRX53217.1 GTP cyclohydrolase 1 type 2 [Aequorivita lipolytica]
MKIKEVIALLEELAPLPYSEDFDNTGLLLGDQNANVSGILVTLDTLENVVDEAIEKKCNLIVSFHPIIFSGLKKITGKTYVERVVQKAIKHDIAIFSNHSALDNSWNGVNAMICEKLGLKNRSVLIPQNETIKKLITFVPSKDAEKVRNALFAAGGGDIGNYENCSFNIEGRGSFKGNKDSNPVIGKKGEIRFEEEIQIGITFSKHLQTTILKALFETHPYEEVAYEITTLENQNQHLGMGMIGELDKAMDEEEFLKFLKETMKTDCVRHSAMLQRPIKKIAVLGGSGSFAIDAAKNAGADAFISADFKYHDFFKAENTVLLADIGHYESEQYTKDLLHSFLKKKITNFAVLLSQINTNPISYL